MMRIMIRALITIVMVLQAGVYARPTDEYLANDEWKKHLKARANQLSSDSNAVGFINGKHQFTDGTNSDVALENLFAIINHQIAEISLLALHPEYRKQVQELMPNMTPAQYNWMFIQDFTNAVVFGGYEANDSTIQHVYTQLEKTMVPAEMSETERETIKKN
ncbi:MAG: hypothetical protein LBF56_01840 [Holosporales bacterium]|nr:hypothetical protein [Holosporales bacterium]